MVLSPEKGATKYPQEFEKEVCKCKNCGHPVGTNPPLLIEIKRDLPAFILAFIAAVISCVTVYVVAQYTYFSKGQWQQMIRTADTADKTLKEMQREQRPWIFWQKEKIDELNITAQAGQGQNIFWNIQ